MARTLGQTLDFLGATLPELEQGDVVTDAVVVLVCHGETGEYLVPRTTQDMSWVKAAGALSVAAAKAIHSAYDLPLEGM